ncbi:MAG: HAD family hydrolase [Gammaproteobacteria bacterium]
MKQTVIYALDFDGVICDSAVETGVAGWKAAAQIWPEMATALPPQNLIDGFREVRPIIETGYEAILVMRMLHQGMTVNDIFESFPDKKQGFLDQSSVSIDALKKLFGETRDVWIDKALDEWVTMNPLFPDVAEKLRHLNEQAIWYIVTTKQERFVMQILNANGIEMPAERIYGLDRNMGKEAVLIELLNKHPIQTLYFVEDRLPTLLNVLHNEKLRNLKLLFAAWGYNTAQDKREALNHPIESIDLGDFLSAYLG